MTSNLGIKANSSQGSQDKLPVDFEDRLGRNESNVWGDTPLVPDRANSSSVNETNAKKLKLPPINKDSPKNLVKD
jgi:hypothetical protein